MLQLHIGFTTELTAEITLRLSSNFLQDCTVCILNMIDMQPRTQRIFSKTDQVFPGQRNLNGQQCTTIHKEFKKVHTKYFFEVAFIYISCELVDVKDLRLWNCWRLSEISSQNTSYKYMYHMDWSKIEFSICVQIQSKKEKFKK